MKWSCWFWYISNRVVLVESANNYSELGLPVGLKYARHHNHSSRHVMWLVAMFCEIWFHWRLMQFHRINDVYCSHLLGHGSNTTINVSRSTLERQIPMHQNWSSKLIFSAPWQKRCGYSAQPTNAAQVKCVCTLWMDSFGNCNLSNHGLISCPEVWQDCILFVCTQYLDDD